MATVYNIAGTTSHTFTLGDGTTIFYGKTEPSDSMGKIGDIYVRMTKLEKDFVIVDDMQERDDYPNEYQTETGNPLPIGSVVQVENVGYYSWNGTSWDLITDYNLNEPLGRIYYKEAFGNGARWSYIKTYSFDENIIHATETSRNSNDFKIELESADNSGVSSSTPSTDYTVNRSAYGVTRFATDTEAHNAAYNDVNEYFIVETPKQIAYNINVEKVRAETAEGVLQNNINAEALARDTKDINLQQQIDAITSKSDVVDIVQCYDRGSDTSKSDIVHYDTSKLGNDDIVKVLNDEENNNQVSYYRYVRTPAAYAVRTDTKAELNAYDTSLLHENDMAIVNADESLASPDTGKTSYYKLVVSGGTKTWEYQGLIQERWDYIGSVETYYTKAESNSTFVYKELNDTVGGTKTFTGSIVLGNNASFNGTSGSVSVSTQQQGDNSTKAASTAYVDTAISNEHAKVVWLTGDQNSIAGNKTFTGQILAASATKVTVPTATQSDSDTTKAASTGYVKTAISEVRQVPLYYTTDADNCLSVSHDGQSLVWREIKDFTKLSQLDDTSITSTTDPQNPLTSGQTLIYDATGGPNGAGVWVNGNQVSATIIYH